jgi:hypothetical protein
MERDSDDEGNVFETGNISAVRVQGKEIFYPEDLLAVIASDSASGQAIAKQQQALSKTKQRARRSLLALGISLGSAIGAGLSADIDGELPPAGGALLGVSLVGLTASMVYVIGASFSSGEAVSAKNEAFLRYEESLRARLGLCEIEGWVHDCARSAEVAAEVAGEALAPEELPAPAAKASPDPQRCLEYLAKTGAFLLGCDRNLPSNPPAAKSKTACKPVLGENGTISLGCPDNRISPDGCTATQDENGNIQLSCVQKR